MINIERNVADITPVDRQALERICGQKLADEQRVVITVADASCAPSNGKETAVQGTLEDWAIFANLSDQEIAELEEAILQRSPGREFDI